MTIKISDIEEKVNGLVEDVQEMLDERDVRIDDLEDEVSNKQDRIDELETEVNDLKEEIENNKNKNV